MTTAPTAAPKPAPAICQPAIDLVKRFEGLYLHAYLCPAGVPTIGWGSTGPEIRLGQVWTQQQADERLARDVQRFADGVDRLVTVPATANERAALYSFAYNLGLGALGGSTLLRLLNAGRPRAEVAAQFLRWTKAGGRELPGLVRRRHAERDLFLMPME